MVLKKRTILLLAILILLINIASFCLVFLNTGEKATGAASSTIGTAEICVAKPPTITAIADQSVTVSTAFTLQVSATFYGSNTSINYTDNSSLFDINQSGYISFTPIGSQQGTHTILITVTDSSNCNISASSTATFSLTISAAGGQGGGAGGGDGGAGG